MLTLGIDLASQPSKTAACIVDWTTRPATVRDPVTNLDDQHLLDLIADADKVGIDSPFGWPEPFVEAISAHASLDRWPRVDLPHLRYRYTDLIVTQICRRPLSVSSDMIAVAAMRCARLLSALDERGEPVDRSGAGKVVEVYPAAALAVWGLDPAGYKRASGLEKRKILVAAIERRTVEILVMSEGVLRMCIGSDDCLDALVASLVARAAALGLTRLPLDEHLEQARREGWIHLPTADSLARLSDA